MASLNDLVDLDRSALQQRLERHAEYEEDLGSLPEIMPDSLLEGTDVGSNGFTREDEAYESPMEDVGKENQTPVGGFNTARLIGKTEVCMTTIRQVVTSAVTESCNVTLVSRLRPCLAEQWPSKT